jgi:hypothetical protein
MSMGTTTVVAETPEDRMIGVSAFDWCSVAGGAAIAAALAFLLLTFGSAIGFAVVSPWSGAGPSGTTLGIIGAAWYLFVSLLSYLVGGYVAGRLRARRGDGTAQESHIRDGLHGLGTWGVGVLLTVIMAAVATSMVGAGAAKLGDVAANAAATQRGTDIGPSDYMADLLFRRDQPGTGAAETPPAVKAEAGRIIGRSLANNGQFADNDRAYLSRLIASTSGVDQAQADQRVNQVSIEVQRLTAQAKEAADKARRAAAIGAFLTAAAFMIALAGSWIGAVYGGRHREEGTIFRPLAPRLA